MGGGEIMVLHLGGGRGLRQRIRKGTCSGKPPKPCCGTTMKRKVVRPGCLSKRTGQKKPCGKGPAEFRERKLRGRAESLGGV